MLIPLLVVSSFFGGLLFKRARSERARLEIQFNQLQGKYDQETINRQAERSGRIKLQQKLREDQSAGVNPSDSADDAANIPVKPIAHVKSCFSQRNGTPRQPLLVPLARAEIQLLKHVPSSALEGLEGYSHAWILYAFHENTDYSMTPQARMNGIKGKIRVPRLNGASMGVLATRTPHRPNPIGLSVAQIIEVRGNTLIIGGADIVDGSPVLDIKPYVPFCDAVTNASAPAWVREEASEEPLKISSVLLPAGVQSQLLECWSRRRTKSLYLSGHEFVQFVQQVLSRDIRSVHQRMTHQDGSVAAPGVRTAHEQPSFHVILDGVDVSYIVNEKSEVHVTGGTVYSTKQTLTNPVPSKGESALDC